MAALRLEVGAIALTRVPWIELPIDPALVGLDRTTVRATTIDPAWASTDGDVHFAQCAWVIDTGDRRIVVDPAAATDSFLRNGADAVGHQAAFVAAMAAGGYPVETIDTLVLTHLDGIGMTASTDGAGQWWPTFPNARIVISAQEVAAFADEPERADVVAFEALRAAHPVVDTVDASAVPVTIAPGVELILTGAHTAGHCVVDVRSNGARAMFLGHMPVTPVHAEVGCHDLNGDSDAAAVVMLWLLESARDDGAIVIGSLWPAPGAARVGHDLRLAPATTN